MVICFIMYYLGNHTRCDRQKMKTYCVCVCGQGIVVELQYFVVLASVLFIRGILLRTHTIKLPDHQFHM